MLTINNAVDSYLLAVQTEGKSPKTVRAYTDILHAFMAGVKEELVEELTDNHIRIYMADLPARAGRYGKMSSSSQMKHYAVIRTFIRWLYAQGHISRCLTNFTRPPTISNDLPGPLSDAEFERLKGILSERPYRDQVIFEVFLDTGLKLSEVCNLNLSDIDIEDRWICVKSKGSNEAAVPMGRTLADDLQAYIVNDRKPKEENKTALFLNRFGTRLEYEGLAMLIKRILKEVGVEGKGGADALRHTFASLFLRNGGSAAVLRGILRQDDISIIQRYYSKTNDGNIVARHNRFSPLDHWMKDRNQPEE